MAKHRQRDVQNSIEQENSLYFDIKQSRAEIKNSIAMHHRLHEELTLRIQKFELDHETALHTRLAVEEKKSVLERQVQMN